VLLCFFCFSPYFPIFLLTPVAGSNLLEEKVSRFSELSQNSNCEELFQSKTSNLVKWTKLIAADYSFKFSAFRYTSTSGAFPCTFLFRKEPFKYLGDLWIHSTAPRNEHSKTDVPSFEISEICEISQEKFGKWRLFSPSEFDPAPGVTRFYTNFETFPPSGAWKC